MICKVHAQFPSAPTSLSAAGVTGVAGRIDLTWTNVFPTLYTRVYRSSTLVTTVNPGVATYSNTTGLSDGTQYTYTVRHYNPASGVESADSSSSSAFTTPTVQAISSLTNLSDTSIRVNLTLADTAAQTEVYVDGVLGATASAAATTATLTGLTRATDVAITVKSLKNSLRSAASAPTTGRPVCSATGGTISTVLGIKYHVFDANGTFTLVVGGKVSYKGIGCGGDGGAGHDSSGGATQGGGGGAAGNIFQATDSVEPANPYAIVIGTRVNGGTTTYRSESATAGGSGTVSDNTTCGHGGNNISFNGGGGFLANPGNNGGGGGGAGSSSDGADAILQGAAGGTGVTWPVLGTVGIGGTGGRGSGGHGENATLRGSGGNGGTSDAEAGGAGFQGCFIAYYPI